MTTRRFAYCLAAGEAASDFVAKDPVSGIAPLYLVQNSILFAYDETDSSTIGDGVTCLVTNDACRYKSDTIAPPWSVKDKDLTAQPVSPADGDRYLLPTAATGVDWAGKDGRIGIYKGTRWHFAIVPIGRLLYVEDEAAFYHRNTSGVWTAGIGSIALGANSVDLTKVLGANASFVIKIENQTTNAPPGSRVTGATPTAPLGGTAANLNDDNDATVCTTGAIGDLTAVSLSSRFFARLDLGSVRSIVAVDLRALLLSVAGPAVGLQIYTSTDGTNWTAYGTSFSATNVAGNILRTGAVNARYIAAAALAANYGSITIQVAGLNVYDTNVTGTVGTAYIIGPSPTSVWSGNAGKLAICLTAGSFTIITPVAGDTVYDKSLSKSVTYTGAAWDAANNALVLLDTKIASSSATIDFLIPQNDIYDSFEIRIASFKPATDDVDLQILVGTGSGPTYQTSAYESVATFMTSSGFNNYAQTAQSQILATFSNPTNKVGNATGENISLTVKFDNPEAANPAMLMLDGAYTRALDSKVMRVVGAGQYLSAAAMTAIRFKFSSGNIAAGRASLYALRKS